MALREKPKHRHTVTVLRNPFLRCFQCKKPVKGFVSSRNDPRRCSHIGQLYPCGCLAETTTACATWTLKDGCVCKNPTVEHSTVSFDNPDHTVEARSISHRLKVDASDSHPPPHTRRRRG